MKLKYTPGIEYIFNYIESFPKNKEIDLDEFVSEMFANKYQTELVVYWSIWMSLINKHNKD